MNFTTRPHLPVFVDFETRSAASLRDLGAKAYLRDPSTQVMALAFCVDGEYGVWLPGGLHGDNVPPCTVWDTFPEPLLQAMDDGRTFVAHNAFGFDALCWHLHIDREPLEWYDTQFACRANSLPVGLDRVGKYLGLGGKDEGGKKAMLRLSRARRLGERVVYDPGKWGDWAEMAFYAVQDVRVLVGLHERVRLTEREAMVVAADIAINERGCPVDLDLALKLREMWAVNEATAAQAMSDETDGELNAENVRSVKQVKDYLAKHGLRLGSIEKKQLERFFEDPEGAEGWDPHGLGDTR